MTTAPSYGWFLAMLISQGPWVYLRTPRLPPAEGPGHGVHGASNKDAGPLKILALGDSIIAGVGVSGTNQALPSRFAEALAPVLSRCVHWQAIGLNGQRSRSLVSSLESAAMTCPSPDLVLISNGINDVTRPHRPEDVLAWMKDALGAIQEQFQDSTIAQLGLPPLGRFPGLPRPLKTVLGARSDAIDAALGEWISHQERMIHLPFDEPANAEDFARDGYHPNAAGVSRWAQHLATTVSEQVFTGSA